MMKKEELSSDSFNRLWKFFTSLRLTVIVLLLLAATSIIGTVIPQNESPAAYYREYGAFLYRLFDLFDIFDMYHSWWFQFLLLMLTLNIIVCSLNRLSVTWKIVFTKKPPFNTSRFRCISDKEEFNDNRSPEHLKERYASFVSRNFGYSRIEKTKKGFCIFADKGRWTRLGVYTVHMSVILLLLGGLVGSIFGFDGYVSIPEGGTINSVRLRKTREMQKLSFGIRCDKFNVSFYESGKPKEYRSSLTIFEDDEPVFKKDILVNHPLRYMGVNIFQSSYGTFPPREFTLSFTSAVSGMVYKKKALIGQDLDIPEGMGKFVIKKFKNSLNFRGHNIGDAFIGTLNPDKGNPIDIILPVHFPDFDKMRRGNVVIAVTDFNHRYYTGLQVTKDPGVWVVYAGFIMMIIGCYITFFMSHQRFYIEVIENGEKSRVMVAGIANKNKLGMQNKVKKLSQKLAEI